MISIALFLLGLVIGILYGTWTAEVGICHAIDTTGTTRISGGRRITGRVE